MRWGGDCGGRFLTVGVSAIKILPSRVFFYGLFRAERPRENTDRRLILGLLIASGRSDPSCSTSGRRERN